MRWYIDTSAALKLIKEEAESTALATLIDGAGADLVGGMLLETELRRAVHRDPALTQGAVSDLLEGISLFDMPRSVFTEAGLLSGAFLRSLDALHIVTAVRCGAEALLTYDARMAEAATDAGLRVIAPK